MMQPVLILLVAFLQASSFLVWPAGLGCISKTMILEAYLHRYSAIQVGGVAVAFYSNGRYIYRTCVCNDCFFD